jgi:hypothetical protein
MRLAENDSVASIALVSKEQLEEAEVTDEGADNAPVAE